MVALLANRCGATAARAEEASSVAAASAVAASGLGDRLPSAAGSDRLRDEQRSATGLDQLSDAAHRGSEDLAMRCPVVSESEAAMDLAVAQEEPETAGHDDETPEQGGCLSHPRRQGQRRGGQQLSCAALRCGRTQ